MLYSLKKGEFGNTHNWLQSVLVFVGSGSAACIFCLLLWISTGRRTYLQVPCLIRPYIVDWGKHSLTRILFNFWQVLSIWFSRLTNNRSLPTWVVFYLTILCSGLYLDPYTMSLLQKTLLVFHTGSNRNDVLHRNVCPDLTFPWIP